MRDFTYVIKDPVGLHARPAGLLVKKAGGLPAGLRSSPKGKALRRKS